MRVKVPGVFFGCKLLFALHPKNTPDTFTDTLLNHAADANDSFDFLDFIYTLV